MNIGVSGNDWLGLGAISQGAGMVAQAKSVEGCGVRPNCLFGKSCNERKAAFDQCVQTNQDLRSQELSLQSRAIDAGALSSKNQSSNMKWVYIILGVILLVLIIKMIK